MAMGARVSNAVRADIPGSGVRISLILPGLVAAEL